MRRRLWLYLDRQAPVIGSGWRLCECQIGPKWVRLVPVSSIPELSRGQRIRRSAFETIRRRHEPEEFRKAMVA